MNYDSPMWEIADFGVRAFFSFILLTALYALAIRIFDLAVLWRGQEARVQSRVRTPDNDRHSIPCKACGRIIDGTNKLEAFQNYSQHYSKNHQ